MFELKYKIFAKNQLNLTLLLRYQIALNYYHFNNLYYGNPSSLNKISVIDK